MRVMLLPALLAKSSGHICRHCADISMLCPTYDSSSWAQNWDLSRALIGRKRGYRKLYDFFLRKTHHISRVGFYLFYVYNVNPSREKRFGILSMTYISLLLV